MKSRRTVTHSDSKRTWGGGRGPRLWAYGYADLAKLLGTTEQAVRSRVSRGVLDPSDLEAVCAAWLALR